MKKFLMFLAVFCVATASVGAVSVQSLSKQDRCLIHEKVKDGHRYWDKDWDALDHRYERRCQIQGLVEDILNK